MGKHNKQGTRVTEFSLEGRFLGLVLEDGDIKYLQLATTEGEIGIKLGKELRAAGDLQLSPGDWVRVVGEKKFSSKNGRIKLKAERVLLAGIQYPAEISPPDATKAKILVCQKSDCLKRGGKAICQALEMALSDRGLAKQVVIKGTGCMKKCSSGPNLVMSDKTRYSRVKVAQVPELLDKHYSCNNSHF